MGSQTSPVQGNKNAAQNKSISGTATTAGGTGADGTAFTFKFFC